MIHWKRLLSSLLLVGLAACGGGGGDSGESPFGSSGGVNDVVVVLSSDTISNAGTGTVSATVTAVDANRKGVSGAKVEISADMNAVVTTTSATTNDAGNVVATIGIGADRSTRSITVTAKVGSKVGTAVLKVTADTSKPKAADLTLVLGSASLTNGGSSTLTATATAVDVNRNVLPGIPVTFSVDSSATAAPSGTVTDNNGVVTAAIGIGSDRSNRVITVTATSGDLVRTSSFAVTGARLTLSTPPMVVAGTAGNVVEYTLVDFNAVPMVEQTITVTSPSLPAATGKTDLNGKYRYTYIAPGTSGTLEITATAAGDQRRQFVTVSPAASGVAPATEMPLSASITPTPSVVTVNSAGSTLNQVELRALFIGANNKPIPRMRARFDLAGDNSSTDGTISWVGSYAYSDENGVARATFTPGQRSSPTGGVTVRMCYDLVDFTSGPGEACAGVPKFTVNTLTVSAEALSVTIRTNELIKSGINDLTYIKEYVVMVVDAAGLAKQDVQITPSVDLLAYRKGFYTWDGQTWVQQLTLANTEHYRWTGSAWAIDSTGAGVGTCPNEDVNRNGVREANPFVPGGTIPDLTARYEDLNWSGAHEPRKADVAVKMVGSSKTNENGIAIVQIEYGRSVASWIDFALNVTASGVLGTEARAIHVGTLPVSALALVIQGVSPPFNPSPFGVSNNCQDTR